MIIPGIIYIYTERERERERERECKLVARMECGMIYILLRCGVRIGN